jgi:hypothetical protein
MNKTCKDYEMDLMHKASGEIDYIKDKDALEQHLKGCSVCQKVLKGFIEVDTFAAATRPPSNQFQKKMADLRQRAEKGPPPLPPDVKWEIGSAAGKVYNCLKENGKTPIPVLRKKTGLVDYPFYEAMGWLAREEKVTIIKDKDGKPAYACLREAFGEGTASLNPGM